MRVLVNYDIAEKRFLSMLAVVLKSSGVQAYSSTAVMGRAELIAKAKTIGAEAILCINEATLQELVYDKTATLDAYRGSRMMYEVPVFVVNSLSHMVSKPEGEWLLRRDLTKLRNARVPNTPFSFTAMKDVNTFQAVEDFLAECLLISLDIETVTLNEISKKKDPDTVSSGDTLISCISWTGLHPSKGIHTFVLPLLEFTKEYWHTDTEYAAAIGCMQRINANDIVKVMQNGMYDATHLIRYHAEPNNWQLDTYGMGWAEYSELSRDLSYLSSLHLFDHMHWKEESDTARKNNDLYAYWTYNAKDSWYTLRIAIEQLRTMPRYAYVNYAMHFKLVYPCLYCSFEGILVDNVMRLEVKTKAEKLLAEALTNLQKMVADPNFNPGSWQQVSKYIYDVFGAKKPKIGKSASCTDEKNLKAVGEQHPLLARITEEILVYRENQKAIGTYFVFRQKKDRLLYALDPFGTDSGRMACKASSMWCGTQVQNIPGYAKGMLIADAEYELVEIDNKQSEARCTGYLAKEYNLVAALEDAEKDFYKQLGTLFFQIPYEEVTDFFRNEVLKRIVHGTNYMMGAGTFIENIGARVLYETAQKLGIEIVLIAVRNDTKRLTLKQFAQSLLDVYHTPFPRIRQWYKELYNEVLTTGMVVSPNGFTRKFFGDIAKSHDMLRSVVAHQPQNLSVELLNKGFYRIYKELVLKSEGRFRLKAQIHDSVFAQYKKDERSYWVPRMKELLRNPITIYGRELIIPTDAKCGPSWNKKAMHDA